MNVSENFDSSTYVGVNERLSAFRKKYPEGSLTTFRNEVEGGVSFKAVVFRNKDEATLFTEAGIAASSGHSFLPGEMEGEKVEEYAETVSVGRALALLGFGVERSIASSEEMEQYARKTGKETKAGKEDKAEPEKKTRTRRTRNTKTSEEPEAETEATKDEEVEEKSSKVRRVSRFKRS